jgi:hypothetical protein
MPSLLELAYEGNYVGRVNTFFYFTYKGKLYHVWRDIVSEVIWMAV